MKRALLLLILIGCAYDPSAARYIIDGDTFVLNNGSTVRLMGIDAPEKGDVNYDRAAYELQRRLVGRQLAFEGDTEDKYGRLLRFVFAEGTNVNLELVRNGWARAFMHTGTKYEALLTKAQEEALIERKGIWNIDDRQYQRLSARCIELGCPVGTIAVASKYGDVFYNCACAAAYLITPENLVCYQTIQDAIAIGLRETRKC
jgi:endonuclease YncB( thermonuclease family)